MLNTINRAIGALRNKKLANSQLQAIVKLVIGENSGMRKRLVESIAPAIIDYLFYFHKETQGDSGKLWFSAAIKKILAIEHARCTCTKVI